MTAKTSLAKPFLKWVGGKNQLLEQFEALYPQTLKQGKIDKYFELFVGGGAVFFALVQKYSLTEVFLNDINSDLILAYRAIQQQPDKLISLLTKLEQNYHQSNLEQRREIYYQIRLKYNRQRANFDYHNLTDRALDRVVYLLFLNKTCFNGLYRTNAKGDFNVPIGRYKKPTICDRDNILKASSLLQNVTLNSGSYQSLDRFIDSNSFVYLDPPYRPITKTSNFTAYAKSSFSDRNQIELSRYYRHLSTNRRAKVMLSNSNPHNTDTTDNFFHKLYRDYSIHEVTASRAINSKASKRGKIMELVITNY